MPKQARTRLLASDSDDARRPPPTAHVWDPLVRIFHWSLVVAFGIAYLTRHWSGDLHQSAGWFAAGLILLRLFWGIVGTPYARFSQFIRNPVTVAGYLLAIMRGRESRYVGHNPAGGAMVLMLMASMAATAATGWMMTTDAYFGVDWVGQAHELAAHVLLLLVLLHIGGVVLASYRHGENLVKAMVTGRKREAESEDIA